MLRPLLHVSAALALAAIILPSTERSAAAPDPGLRYDEIVQVIVDATPPAPGDFLRDLAALAASPAPVAATPRPRRGFGLGALAGAVLGGAGIASLAGSAASTAAETALNEAMERALGAPFGAWSTTVRTFLAPHRMQYAFWNGWERVDDVTARTATIRKCPLGQVVDLDLARKTYALVDLHAPPSGGVTSAPRPARGAARPAAPAPPGTAVVSLTSRTKALDPVRIDDRPTSGYASTTTVAMTQATGSCHDGSASIDTVEYLSPLARPAVAACPIDAPPPIPENATEALTPPGGGCQPTFAFQRSGPAVPVGRLALYELVSLGAGNGSTLPSAAATGNGIAFLTERGNLQPLGSGAASLFDIPAGFTAR